MDDHDKKNTLRPNGDRITSKVKALSAFQPVINKSKRFEHIKPKVLTRADILEDIKSGQTKKPTAVPAAKPPVMSMKPAIPVKPVVPLKPVFKKNANPQELRFQAARSKTKSQFAHIHSKVDCQLTDKGKRNLGDAPMPLTRGSSTVSTFSSISKLTDTPEGLELSNMTMMNSAMASWDEDAMGDHSQRNSSEGPLPSASSSLQGTAATCEVGSLNMLDIAAALRALNKDSREKVLRILEVDSDDAASRSLHEDDLGAAVSPTSPKDNMADIMSSIKEVNLCEDILNSKDADFENSLAALKDMNKSNAKDLIKALNNLQHK